MLRWAASVWHSAKHMEGGKDMPNNAPLLIFIYKHIHTCIHTYINALHCV